MNLVELGAALKREREERGLSMSEIMDATKISRRNLIALEEGDVAAWPHPVYLKGYVRNYAQLVGLDPEAFAAVVEAHIDAHMHYVQEAPAAATGRTAEAAGQQPPAAPAPSPASAGEKPVEAPAKPAEAAEKPAEAAEKPTPPGAPEEPLVLRLVNSEPLGQPVQKWQPGNLAIVALLLLVAVLAGFLYQYLSRQDDESTRPVVTAAAPAVNATGVKSEAPLAPPAATAAVAPNATAGETAGNASIPTAPAPMAATPQSAAPQPAASASAAPGAAAQPATAPAATGADGKPLEPGAQVLTLTGKPDVKVSWVGVYVGRKATTFLLHQGQSRKVEFKGHARVILSNGGAVAVSLNGAAYPFAGEAGKKTKLEIGPR